MLVTGGFPICCCLFGDSASSFVMSVDSLKVAGHDECWGLMRNGRLREAKDGRNNAKKKC